MRDSFYDFADETGMLLKPGEIFTSHLGRKMLTWTASFLFVEMQKFWKGK
jgi:hypothetical protein